LKGLLLFKKLFYQKALPSLVLYVLSQSGHTRALYGGAAFFGDSTQVAMFTYGTGLARQLLGLFWQETYAGTRDNTLLLLPIIF